MQTIPIETESTDRGTTIVIADSNVLHAESVSWCLNAYGAFCAVDHVTNLDGLLDVIRSQRPSVVVIAESIIVDAIRSVTSELAVKLAETRIAVFADRLTDRQLDLVTNNPITGLLSRQEGTRKICDQLIRIASGAVVLSAQLENRVTLDEQRQFQCTASRQMTQFTDRQWDVLLRVAEGVRVPEVAEELQISRKAVEAHKHRIMQRLGASDRVELCRWAIREGLIHA
ncbi:MAG: response regulator transcription factor [Fuerstiella sp.]|nr:response regulator transcription factor [Fuerstiella sp.]